MVGHSDIHTLRYQPTKINCLINFSWVGKSTTADGLKYHPQTKLALYLPADSLTIN